MNLMTLFFLLVFSLLLAVPKGMAEDEDLQEASGLSPREETSQAEEHQQLRDPTLRWRAYGLIDGSYYRSRREKGTQKLGPNLETGLRLDHDLPSGFKAFLQARAWYNESSSDVKARLDQGGISLTLDEAWMIALGKERNRRAPGLLLSPSDFLHSNPSAPGMREDLRGVWLSRLSWQTSDTSLDLIYLPVDIEQDNGFPASSSRQLGEVFRAFHRSQLGFDLGLDLASLDNALKIGSFAQGFVQKSWKLFGEFGYDQDQKSHSELLGLSYEGWSDTTLHGEIYHKDLNWSSQQTPYILDQTYAILSLRLFELWQDFSISETWLKSLESRHFVNLFRLEWGANDQQVIGLSLIHQDPARPIQWQALADWKFSF